MTDELCGAPTGGDEPCQNPATDGDSCWIESHGGSVSGHGRPSKFDTHRDAVLEAAEEPIKTRDVARTAGVGKSTLYDWLDESPDFSDEFRRRRAHAARDLVRRGLEDPDVDTSMIRFLLERTFDYTKRQEVEHTGSGLDLTLSTDEKALLEDAFGSE